MKKTKKALAVVLGTLLVACMSLFVLAACGPKEPKALDSIEITTQPTKTTYVEGEKFDPAGMVVTAKFNDDTAEAVTDYTLSPSTTTELTTANDKVTVSYKYEDVTKKAEVAITVKAWDADIPEDSGTLADHVFEAEAAEYTGVSSNNGTNFGHACMGKSYFFDASLSGGICVRNVSPKSGDAATENNAFTFKFTSDKAVKVKMEISVASRFDNNAWSAMAFNQMYTTVVNDRTISGDVEVPAATEADKIQNNNYACMKTIEIPVTLKQGENTIVFKSMAKSCNLDYINIKTSANLTGWTNHYWGDVEETVEIAKAPTLNATGTIKFLCSGETAVADHPSTFTMPALTDDFYTDNGNGTYSFTLMGKKFDIVGEVAEVITLTAKSCKLEIVEEIPYFVIVSEYASNKPEALTDEKVIAAAQGMYIDAQEINNWNNYPIGKGATITAKVVEGLCYSYIDITKLNISANKFIFHYKTSADAAGDGNFNGAVSETAADLTVTYQGKIYTLATISGEQDAWKNGLAGISVTQDPDGPVIYDLAKVNNDAGAAGAKGKWTYYIQGAVAGTCKMKEAKYNDGEIKVTFTGLSNTATGANSTRIYYMIDTSEYAEGTEVTVTFKIKMNVNGTVEISNAASKKVELTAGEEVEVTLTFTVGATAIRICPIVAAADNAEVTTTITDFTITASEEDNNETTAE